MRLYYVPKEGLDKITAAKDLSVLTDALRLNILYMVQQAGSGHLGGSLSSLTIMVPLFFGQMGPDDIFISSKGHDAPALYAILQAKGTIPFDSIHTFRRPGGLPGHPTIDVPGVMFNTGSLGMGISKANGLAAADRMTPMFYPETGETKPQKRKIHVLVGDGELQEGQNWEAIRNLHENVSVHIDYNRFQLSRETKEPFYTQFEGGQRVIGHSTIKGAGISFMEGNNEYHAGRLSEDEYARAIAEIENRIFINGGGTVHLDPREKFPYPRPCQPSYGLLGYSLTLAKLGANKKVVVMDADLEPDCGLSEFHRLYPDRFIQCGIAEQNMVSMATGLAAGGFIPIVHSFASFLCRRANEQIYNACLERRHIIFVGTMAGILPVGPGTSHECINDIEIMKTMPGITILKPQNGGEIRIALEWAVNEATGPVYISLQCWELEGMRR